MCCRILNSNNPDIPVTGRNLNWLWTTNADLYVHPKGIEKVGVSKAFAESQQIEEMNIFTWTSKYASASCIMHGLHQGKVPKNLAPYENYELACSDGMNEAGLVVNAMLNNETDYGEVDVDDKVLSTIRWGQYVLDSFATVEEAIAELSNPSYRIIDQGMPDASDLKAQFFLAISDASGNSAIVEYEGHKVVIHSSPKYRIATNQPNYEAHLKFSEYWDHKWGMSQYTNKMVNHEAPGGYSAPDVFQKAAYNLAFSAPMKSTFLVTSQTRSILASVVKPVNFNRRWHKKPDSMTFYCIWSTIGVPSQQRFYFTHSFIGNNGYLDIHEHADKCVRVQVSSLDQDELEQFAHLNGNLSQYTSIAETVPFQR